MTAAVPPRRIISSDADFALTFCPFFNSKTIYEPDEFELFELFEIWMFNSLILSLTGLMLSAIALSIVFESAGVYILLCQHKQLVGHTFERRYHHDTSFALRLNYLLY